MPNNPTFVEITPEFRKIWIEYLEKKLSHSYQEDRFMSAILTQTNLTIDKLTIPATLPKPLHFEETIFQTEPEVHSEPETQIIEQNLNSMMNPPKKESKTNPIPSNLNPYNQIRPNLHLLTEAQRNKFESEFEYVRDNLSPDESLSNLRLSYIKTWNKRIEKLMKER